MEKETELELNQGQKQEAGKENYPETEDELTEELWSILTDINCGLRKQRKTKEGLCPKAERELDEHIHMVARNIIKNFKSPWKKGPISGWTWKEGLDYLKYEAKKIESENSGEKEITGEFDIARSERKRLFMKKIADLKEKLDKAHFNTFYTILDELENDFLDALAKNNLIKEEKYWRELAKKENADVKHIAEILEGGGD